MNKVAIQPLGDNVLIQPMKQEQKTESGIFLPETASKERSQQGKVVAIGESEDILVKKGQTVIFKEYSETKVEYEGKEYLLVKAEDILAIIG